MSKKPLPRIVTGAVITTIAVAALLTFTRGETPATDTASASLPSVSGTNEPVVEGATPEPSSSPSADTAEREASSRPTTTASKPVRTPTSAPPKPRPSKPDPTQAPSPSPSPSPNNCGLLILLGCK
ncbi:hypothetical protein GCM10022234_03800 [Aeromicrobium panaciterrae]|uniref:hypothetical protein n=1 Tax=Aeromicrobium panaciterrae TaxID=363861 RepID=UPI0031E24246